MKKEKIATYSNLINKIKIRHEYALSAMERESMSGDLEKEQRADTALDAMIEGSIDYIEVMYYAEREKEWRELND